MTVHSSRLGWDCFIVHFNSITDLFITCFQGPLVETAASCFGMTNPNTAQLQNGHINGTIDHMTPYHSPNDTQSPQVSTGSLEYI